jgi:WD40 repeat protein
MGYQNGAAKVLEGHQRIWVISASFSPDGQQVSLLQLMARHGCGMWKQGFRSTFLQGHKDRIISASFSPDGQQVASPLL